MSLHTCRAKKNGRIEAKRLKTWCMLLMLTRAMSLAPETTCTASNAATTQLSSIELQGVSFPSHYAENASCFCRLPLRGTHVP